MKLMTLEYYDWVDREWKPVPDYPAMPEDVAMKEHKALIKKGAYRKYKTRLSTAE